MPATISIPKTVVNRLVRYPQALGDHVSTILNQAGATNERWAESFAVQQNVLTLVPTQGR
jgi:hypothetical protein